MQLDEELLELLRCPESGASLAPASGSQLEALNRAIARGRLRDREGRAVVEPLDSALVRQSGDLAYPVRAGIADLLVESGIPLDQLGN